jgi:hypothetical protein
MTAAERQSLERLVRDRGKVAKADAEARGKWLLADAEAKLAAVYKREDEAWEDIVAAVEKAVEEADAALAALCRERGIPEEFRPFLRCGFAGRGENAFEERRRELRRVVQTQVAARVHEAKVEIDRQVNEQLTQITQAGLTSEEARAFIGSMPKPEHLLPPLGSLQMDSGEILVLETSVTQVTPNGVSVTDRETHGVTASRNMCARCGQEFTPSRRDGKYCRPSCRVADFRRRQAASAGPDT